MKIRILSFVAALGLISAFAEVRGLSAQVSNFMDPSTENTKKIENYWLETGLSIKDATQLISNAKCHNSAKYFRACLNAIVENALTYNLKLSRESGSLVKVIPSERFDEKSEKELLLMYSNTLRHVDFNRALAELVKLEIETKQPLLAARIINSFLSVYVDPHTYILPTSFYDEVGSKIDRSKFFVGISYEKSQGEFYIRKISKNSDADISGLKTNDKVLAINSVNLKGFNYAEMSNLLKSEESNVLKFRLERNNRVFNINVRRSYRTLSHVQYNELSQAGNIGLITLTKFSRGVCANIAEKLLAINQKKIDGLILDLRDNPGGQLNEASCIAGLFLGKNKKAYYVDYFDAEKSNEVVMTSDEQLYSGPLVVLVNSASASASELIAGGLQDYKRALIVGERTFGKGTFQEPEKWFLNSKVSLYKTQGLYLLPSRNSTQLEGVKPDVELHSELNPVRREGVAFFNPVKALASKYSKLKKSEMEDKYTFNLCKNTESIRNNDIYLQESLRYLNCARPIEKLTFKLSNRNAGKATALGF